jgi:hypothetical protein
MNLKKNYYVEKEKKIKLTNEEINSFSDFVGLSTLEKEALAEFIYNISIIIYKTQHNE